MRIAAIDIGSNSIKLLVAESARGGSLVALRREKAMVRLGHETLLKEHLSSEAIVMTIRTLNVFKSLAQSLGAEQIIVIATASVREADNAAAFIREVESRTGIRIEVLSGVEEARLIGLAAAYKSRIGGKATVKGKSLLNIDIGGGSTEISLMRVGSGHDIKAEMLHSMKIGAVRLSEQYLSSDPPKPKELLAMQREIEGALERPMREMEAWMSDHPRAKWSTVTGTSGTILALGSALHPTSFTEGESEGNAKGQVLPSFSIGRSALARLNQQLAELPEAGRKKLPGISDQRAEIIVAGGQILEQTMRAFKIPSISTCQWSLREGVLLDRLGELNELRTDRPRSDRPRSDRGRSPSHERSHAIDERLAGAEALGQRFGYEAEHGKHVSVLACELFDQLRSLHGLKEHDRTLLAAAAILHDIGYAISHESHHKHSLYLILNSELTGFTDLERLVIANIARYHRKTFPKPNHPHFASLTSDDQGRVWMLGGLLRLADAMDRSHQSRIKHCKASLRRAPKRALRRDSIRIQLQSARNCEHEIWSIDIKKDMFEEAFGVPIELVTD